MALEALKAEDRPEAIHHVRHIIELLEEGEHSQRMEAIIDSLLTGDTHEPEHEIEGMLAGSASPDLTLVELHLRQALVALTVRDLADTRHHVEHFHELAKPGGGKEVAEILDLLEQGELHQAEHEIRELLGEGERDLWEKRLGLELEELTKLATDEPTST